MTQPLYKRENPRIWRAGDGATFNDQQAQKIGERVEHIAARLGVPYVEVTTDQLYEDAQNTASPLHVNLEWNDNLAAGKWRKHQIRNIMNHLEIEVKDSAGNPVRYKAFFNVNTSPPKASEKSGSFNVDTNTVGGDDDEEGPSRAYVDTEGLVARKEYRQDFVAYCERKLHYLADMIKAYGHAKEFARILKAIKDYEQGKRK